MFHAFNTASLVIVGASLAGMAVVPTLIGAAVLALIVHRTILALTSTDRIHS